VKAAIHALGYDPDILQVILLQMVRVLRAGQPVPMSKRSGQFVELREVVSEVGKDAARFLFLTRRSESQLDLISRWQSGRAWTIRSITFNTRTRGLQHGPQGGRGGAAGPVCGRRHLGVDAAGGAAAPEARRNLSEMVRNAALACEPHRVTAYLQELASAFHGYFTRYKDSEERVISGESRGEPRSAGDGGGGATGDRQRPRAARRRGAAADVRCGGRDEHRACRVKSDEGEAAWMVSRGVTAPGDPDLVQKTFLATGAVQHRGKASAGLAVGVRRGSTSTKASVGSWTWWRRHPAHLPGSEPVAAIGNVGYTRTRSPRNECRTDPGQAESELGLHRSPHDERTHSRGRRAAGRAGRHLHVRYRHATEVVGALLHRCIEEQGASFAAGRKLLDILHGCGTFTLAALVHTGAETASSS